MSLEVKIPPMGESINSGVLAKWYVQDGDTVKKDQPLFELLEGSGEDTKTRPLFSIAEILSGVKEVGRRGIEIKRFKGLGEMNPQQLFSTTMDPAKRKLLRVDLTDAIEAEEMFTTLMGEEVEPRRQFIEDNALNVRNLDV